MGKFEEWCGMVTANQKISNSVVFSTNKHEFGTRFGITENTIDFVRELRS